MARRVPCEVYSRVVGYLRPMKSWNKGKKQEEKERVYFIQPAPDKMAAAVKAIDDMPAKA